MPTIRSSAWALASSLKSPLANPEIVEHILLTGFDPFADWKVNPTAISAELIDGYELNGYHVIGRIIELRYHTIMNQLQQLVEEYKPRTMILTGQAGGSKIRLERNAVNKATTKTPYNCGSIPAEQVLVQGGPAVHHSTLPLERIHRAISDASIPVGYSDSAGRFGCNQIFYYAQEIHPDIPSGFIHVPLLPSQTKKEEHMDQSSITRAIELAVVETVAWLSEQT